jgi:ABC-2 type transport system ATP-binding protein
LTDTALPLVVAGAVVVACLAAALVDLSRHDVRHLPKWAWAAVILFVSFPIGVIVYFVLGRVPSGERGQPADHAMAHVDGTAPVSGTTDLRPAGADATAPSIDAPEDGRPVIATRGLTKRYGDSTALEDVALEVPKGSTYGLIGPNGAGKTTLLSLLAGLRRPTSGEMHIAVPRRAMGVLVDTPQFEPWLRAREVVDLARHLTAPSVPAERVEETLREVGLGAAIDRRVGGFSRGMLQRLGLASVIVGDPEILLLDEPSSALDPSGRREVLDLVGRLAQTKTVLLSTHILSDVQQVCDTVGVIDQGKLRFQGPLTDLLTRTSAAYLLHVRAPAEALRAAIAAQEWVSSVVEQAQGRLHIVVSDAAVAEREVPRLVALHEVALVAFNPATDLETAFLELTS